MEQVNELTPLPIPKLTFLPHACSTVGVRPKANWRNSTFYSLGQLTTQYLNVDLFNFK